jgi:four helix bundle protein
MKLTSRWKVVAFALSQQSQVFDLSKQFPKEEQYSLTSQLRRSSRSVCANLAEANSKKRYIAHFISKLTDAHAENAETNVWLHIALECGYVSSDQVEAILGMNEQITRLINYMIHHPEKFCYTE